MAKGFKNKGRSNPYCIGNLIEGAVYTLPDQKMTGSNPYCIGNLIEEIKAVYFTSTPNESSNPYCIGNLYRSCPLTSLIT